jgi:hypothetical protein
MTPKEKAKELVDKMYGETPVRAVITEIEEDKKYAKQCALIAVDEILIVITECETEYFDNYWQEVKQEIEKL